MIDPDLLRHDREVVYRELSKRGHFRDSDNLIACAAALRAAQTRLQLLQNRRNELAALVGKAVKAKEPYQDLLTDANNIKNQIPTEEQNVTTAQARLDDLLQAIPNIPADDVPKGNDARDNVETHRWGTRREFRFKPRPHYELIEGLGYDAEVAVAIAGTRFGVMRGDLAKLERAIGQFMIDIHTERHGYEEVGVPLLVNKHAMYGTGQLPKFEVDLFKTTDGRYLIPTAEVSLTNLVAEQIIEDTHLPIRMTALTPCFRSEAGSAGADTRGLIRQHQFNKCELVAVCTPDQAQYELNKMIDAAEYILKALDLPYRRMLLCTGDMGFSAQKTFDIEVWFPALNTYREISSVSDCGQFQGRRMKARWKVAGQKGTKGPVNTLNGSGLAVGRTLAALIENHQQADGSVAIPSALVPYTGFDVLRTKRSF